MLIKKYEPALLWNANNGSHGSCLPSQNCSGGWTSDFWKRSHLVSGHHSQLPLIMFWCKRQNYERISGWDPVFGKWCHSNSNQKGDSRIWTVWAGRKGNRSPTGTVIYFFFHYWHVWVKAGLLAGNQNLRRGSDKALKWETLQSHQLLAALLTPPPNLCVREETNAKQSLIKYLIVTLTSPTSQQYFTLTQCFNEPGEISQGFFRLAIAE